MENICGSELFPRGNSPKFVFKKKCFLLQKISANVKEVIYICHSSVMVQVSSTFIWFWYLVWAWLALKCEFNLKSIESSLSSLQPSIQICHSHCLGHKKKEKVFHSNIFKMFSTNIHRTDVERNYFPLACLNSLKCI